MNDALLPDNEAERQSALEVIGRAIEDTIHSGIIITDPNRGDNPIIYCNRGFEALTGYSEDEVLGRNCRFLQGAHTDPKAVAELRKAIADSQECTVTLKNYRKDGTVFWNELTVSPVADAEGHTTHFLGIQTDATEKYLAKERATRVGAVLEASTNEIYIFDEETLRFIHVNRGARENLGYSLEELQALTPVDLKPEYTRESFEAAIRSLRDGGQEKLDFIAVHQRKDGSRYPVEVHLQRSRFDSMPVFVAIILDITERQRAEAMLQQAHDELEDRVLERTAALDEALQNLKISEERYRELFENAGDLIQSVAPDGSFIYVNPAWRKTLGYRDDDISKLSMFDVIHSDDHDHCKSIFDRVLAGEFVGDIETKFVTKSGDVVLVEGNVSGDHKDGTAVGTRAIFHDITQRVAAERSLQEAKEVAESATAAKTRFLAAASHDLRQPLQSIGLYLSVLNRLDDDPTPRAVRDKMRNALDVMSELLDALLDISKLDSGSISPSEKDFSTQKMFDQLVADNEPQAREKGLEFRCEGPSCVVHSDPALLQRIVENFVSNAIRYTDTGSVEVRCESRGDHARIEVRDSGVGIPGEALETIFEEYFQLDNPVRDRRKGLGLGLSIVKHIARLLNHRLDVSSVPGMGSTFAVEVPLGTPIEPPVETHVPLRAKVHTTREPVVLFVDDDPAIVDATTMLLDVSGFHVHAALDGDEALAHLASGVRPDIVVSDFRLPGYNGVELIRRVRQATVGDLPTVLMTGDTSTQEIEAANLPHCTVLHKPVDTDRLIALIEDITQQ